MAKSNISDMMKNIRKKTKSKSYDVSPYAKTDTFIDTGCYSLNAICSGSVFGGIPEGKITTLAGISASGKSYIAAQIAINALQLHDYERVMIFDSEGGGLFKLLESSGVDMSKIEHILVSTIEEATIAITYVYDQIEQLQIEEPDMKFLCLLDSFGALTTTKFHTDALDGKQVQDMGLGVKLKNSLAKSLMIKTLRTNSAMLIINHIYDNPAAMFKSKIQNQSGGHGLQFASNLVVQTSKKLEEDKDNKDAKFNGNRLKFFTVKNRVVKPFYETELYIDFDIGAMKYDGLIEFAKRYNYIIQSGSWYEIPSYTDKKLQMKNIISNDELWNTFINDLDKDIMRDMQYGSKTSDEEIEQINQIDDVDSIE